MDILNEIKVEAFYDDLPARSELDYYRPTRAEMNEYIESPFDRRSTYYEKLERLISEQKSMLPSSNIMRYIETHIQTGKKLLELLDDFQQQELLAFQSENDKEQFVAYYTDLHNHSRLWQLRGHTPLEVDKLLE